MPINIYPKILREAEVLNLADLSMILSKSNRREKKSDQKNAISPLKKPKTSGNPKKLAAPPGQIMAASATQTRTKGLSVHQPEEPLTQNFVLFLSSLIAEMMACGSVESTLTTCGCSA